MKNLDNAIKTATEAIGFKLMLSTPSEQNMRSDTAQKKIIWNDIQQNGSFDIDNDGYRTTTHLKLHLMDDMAWDEDGETANERKDMMVGYAMEFFITLHSLLLEKAGWEVATSPTWQVLYNSFDRNKIDIMLEFDVRTLKFC